MNGRSARALRFELDEAQVLELDLHRRPLVQLQREDAQLIDTLARAQIGRRTLAHGAVTMVVEGKSTAAEAMTIAE